MAMTDGVTEGSAAMLGSVATDRPQPISEDDCDRPEPVADARLAALEELSAIDQELELKYGLTGNPMIKAQRCTQPTPTTPGEGSVRNGCASGRETVR
jgi:hypothetical protein